MVAANVDIVFLVVPLSAAVKPRAVERYLLLAWDSGARPVIVLTKSDLAEDAEAAERAIAGVAFNVPIHRVAALQGLGLEPLRAYAALGATVALLGPSGAGKSTLVNALLGEQRQRVAEVRAADGKGRHTTTHRELVPLPGGGCLLDTPGMRELQLWHVEDEAVEETFADLADLAGGCRFRDCAHGTEPGCAVRAAVEDGRLDGERLASFHKLRAELRSLELRSDPAARKDAAREMKTALKTLKAHPKRNLRGEGRS